MGVFLHLNNRERSVPFTFTVLRAGTDSTKGHGCTHIHPIVFVKGSKSGGIKWPNTFGLGFGCSASLSRKGREGVGMPGGCSSSAKRPPQPSVGGGGGGLSVVGVSESEMVRVRNRNAGGFNRDRKSGGLLAQPGVVRPRESAPARRL